MFHMKHLRILLSLIVEVIVYYEQIKLEVEQAFSRFINYVAADG